MQPFQPLFRNPHLQTIASHYWRRADVSSQFPVERRLFRTEPGVQVLVLTQRPHGPAKGEIVMVHGLEGSADAAYMRSLSAAAVRMGFAAHRANIRTCGGTQHLCPTLYHGGLTVDLAAVLRALRQDGRAAAFIVGFSLGGNIVLKLAGELGESAADLVAGVCAISTPLDLAACAQRIAEPDNRAYERRFVRCMRERLCATGRYRKRDFAGLRTVLQLDDRFTAPSFGFGDAATYYRTQSAAGFLDGIRVPTLLIQAKDDTFVPFDIYRSEAIRANRRIRVIATEYGGHLGFIGRAPRRFWLDHAIMDWICECNANDTRADSSEV
jgi:predicted alpha/beta-fold hydrolase